MRTKFLSLLAICILLVLAAGGMYLFEQHRQPQPQLQAQQPSSAAAEQPEFNMVAASATSPVISAASGTPQTPPAGYIEYRNTEYGFSFFYPQDLSVSVSDDGGGASTFVFQSTTTVQGFQLFVVPYQGTQVTEQRFQEDEPSGVRNDVTTGLLDGVPAAAFYSTDVRLGDTYEVWSIHGGYLFEATTLKPLDSWFQGIMETWQFI